MKYSKKYKANYQKSVEHLFVNNASHFAPITDEDLIIINIKQLLCVAKSKIIVVAKDWNEIFFAKELEEDWLEFFERMDLASYPDRNLDVYLTHETGEVPPYIKDRADVISVYMVDGNVTEQAFLKSTVRGERKQDFFISSGDNMIRHLSNTENYFVFIAKPVEIKQSLKILEYLTSA